MVSLPGERALVAERGAFLTTVSELTPEKFDSAPEPPEVGAEKRRFVERLRGVVFARQYVMLDYDCPVEIREEAVQVTPGVQSPTVAPLSDPKWVAVRSMVRRSRVNDVMDELSDLGCTGIVTASLQSCRAVIPGKGAVQFPRT